MATCCILGRNKPLLVSVGLVGGLFVATALALWLALTLAWLAVLSPAAAVSARARRRWRARGRALVVTLNVSREKLGEVLQAVAPRTRCRLSAALMPVHPGTAGFVYRHFVGLAAAALALLVGGAYVLVYTLTA